MWWHNGMGWGGWLVMTLTMVAFWSLVVFGLVALFRESGSREAPWRASVQPDPFRILDERFARGEMDVEEYHARQQVLRDSGTEASKRTAPRG